MVYVVEGGGLYKIGHSTMPEVRVDAMATGSPRDLELICVFPGGRDAEKALHHRYHPYRLKGEWFNLPDAAVAELQRRAQLAALLTGMSPWTIEEVLSVCYETPIAVIPEAGHVLYRCGCGLAFVGDGQDSLCGRCRGENGNRI